jgi:hypothetical protein
MAEHQLPKLTVRVRFPSPAPRSKAQVRKWFPNLGLARSSKASSRLCNLRAISLRAPGARPRCLRHRCCASQPGRACRSPRLWPCPHRAPHAGRSSRLAHCRAPCAPSGHAAVRRCCQRIGCCRYGVSSHGWLIQIPGAGTSRSRHRRRLRGVRAVRAGSRCLLSRCVSQGEERHACCPLLPGPPGPRLDQGPVLPRPGGGAPGRRHVRGRPASRSVGRAARDTGGSRHLSSRFRERQRMGGLGKELVHPVERA